MKDRLLHLKPLYGVVAVVAAMVLVLGSASFAFAFESGDKPAATGTDTITWTGQGATDGALNTEQCDAQNKPYLLWILTTDGGSASDVELHLGGTGIGDYPAVQDSGNQFHINTPYFTPDTNLEAYADINVDATGNGAWNLVISHGCTGVEKPPAAALDVTKDATGGYDNTIAWTIKKDVNGEKSVSTANLTAPFSYTVTVEHGPSAVSNVKVDGKITVTNPNDDPVDITGVTDQLSDTPTTLCSVTGGGAQTLDPGDTVFDYTCNLSGVPSGDLYNTATVTWGDQTLEGGSELAAGLGNFTTPDPIGFAVNEIDECVNVTDTNVEGPNQQVCASDVNATESTPFTYTHTVDVPRNGCASHDNTATFTTNDTAATGSDSETVNVCGPVTGGLTMGFWQNKNGQDTIKNSPPGCLAGRDALRAYNPFQDLSATATCTQFQTYVTNVIKAANASGASMNAMLKAQMLATALDVIYGKVGGGVNVDLTMIPKPVTSSTYENTSAAFGGGACQTVNALLSYASSQSNVGGSAWYSQVKATQELAKDTFDAINNAKVFACV